MIIQTYSKELPPNREHETTPRTSRNEHYGRKVTRVWTKERLIAIAEGIVADYLFFWGHTPKREGIVDAACFSQWFPCSFLVNGVRYASTEHFMMAEKAHRVCERLAGGERR